MHEKMEAVPGVGRGFFHVPHSQGFFPFPLSQFADYA